LTDIGKVIEEDKLIQYQVQEQRALEIRTLE
jgi:hypothetical protein